jgi:hypothetical protein
MVTAFFCRTGLPTTTSLPHQIRRAAIDSARSSGEDDHRYEPGDDAAKWAIVRAKDSEFFAKKKPMILRAMKKSPLALRASVSSKKAKKPRKKRIEKKKKPKH